MQESPSANPSYIRAMALEWMIKNVLKNDGSDLVVMTNAGIYTGHPYDFDSSKTYPQVNGGMSNYLGGAVIGMRNVTFTPFNASQSRFNFSEVFLFSSDIIGFTNATGVVSEVNL